MPHLKILVVYVFTTSFQQLLQDKPPSQQARVSVFLLTLFMFSTQHINTTGRGQKHMSELLNACQPPTSDIHIRLPHPF